MKIKPLLFILVGLSLILNAILFFDFLKRPSEANQTQLQAKGKIVLFENFETQSVINGRANYTIKNQLGDFIYAYPEWTIIKNEKSKVDGYLTFSIMKNIYVINSKGELVYKRELAVYPHKHQFLENGDLAYTTVRKDDMSNSPLFFLTDVTGKTKWSFDPNSTSAGNGIRANFSQIDEENFLFIHRKKNHKCPEVIKVNKGVSSSYLPEELITSIFGEKGCSISALEYFSSISFTKNPVLLLTGTNKVALVDTKLNKSIFTTDNLNRVLFSTFRSSQKSIVVVHARNPAISADLVGEVFSLEKEGASTVNHNFGFGIGSYMKIVNVGNDHILVSDGLSRIIEFSENDKEQTPLWLANINMNKISYRIKSFGYMSSLPQSLKK